ncbi:holo-ACP synthase [Filifactor villosus]|uniref:Holo-[acyl-carrier-protein] synthase n=1 Tax=Filifactor villosus TaxID=29374 RepID=A0ABV9QJD0_9FIRM
MIYGIGTDIVSVARVRYITEKHPKFLTRFFTCEEAKYFAEIQIPYETIAACFAAKEAVSKAMGTGFSTFSFKDIEVLHRESGAPYIELHRGAKLLFEDLSLKRIHLSLSHEREYAVAYCVIEM